MRTNQKRKPIYTEEGGKAQHINSELALRRSVMSCLLWEKEFYESGEDITKRIASLVKQVEPKTVQRIAIEARNKMKLRHVPLFIVREMARLESHRGLVADTLFNVIQRPDELTEFVSLYWRDGKCPLSAQVKKGLARAFTKFNEHQLAKYNRDNAVKLRDVLFLSHAKPINKTMEKTWKKLIAGELKTPDTWEVALSAGEDKKKAWTRLLKEEKLGALALLRNLRNMREADVDQKLVSKAILTMETERVLPFRFIAAARHAPEMEPQLEESMFRCLEKVESLKGSTCLMVDVSGSMDTAISSKSDLTRIDAACGLAMLLREVCPSVTVCTFSEHLAVLPPRRGFALRDSITHSQAHSGTYLARALGAVAGKYENKFDRMIVITDEQSADGGMSSPWEKSYLINVASNTNGVGYGSWTHIDGWSEAVIDYIKAFEG